MARPFKCKLCNFTFDRASQLDYHHRNIHLGEKSHVCQICSKAFFRKADLHTHLNIHLGVNMCICEVCGKKFNHISNLIRHTRIHAGIKPYPCDICGKRFTQINSLAKHKHIHKNKKDRFQQPPNKKATNNETIIQNLFCTGKLNIDINCGNTNKIKRQYHCKVCGKSYPFILLLRQHEESHINQIESFKCEDCKKIFQCSNDIKDHKCSNKTLENNVKIKKIKSLKHSASRKKVLKIIKVNNEPNECNAIEVTANTCNDINKASEQTKTQLIKLLQNNLIDNSEQQKKSNVEESSTFDKRNLFEKNKEEVFQVTSSNIIDCDLNFEILRNNSDSNNSMNNISQNFEDDSSNKKLQEISSKTNTMNSLDSSGSNNMENFNDLNNSIVNFKEPMLRLVQTETGEQFYELIINVLDKVSNSGSAIHDDKNSEENKKNEDSRIKSNNIQKNIFINKNIGKDDMKKLKNDKLENSLQINNDINKIINHEESYDSKCVQNSIILQHDNNDQIIYTNLMNKDYSVGICETLDSYIETNFEIFEKTNYDSNEARFFELIEIGSSINENKLSEQSSTVCFIEKEKEQSQELFKQPLDMIENDSHKIDCINYITDGNKNKSNLLIYFGNDIQSNTDTTVKQNLLKNDFRTIKNDKTQYLKKCSKPKVKKYHCNVCDKSFSTSYNYKQHIGTHFTDQQKFKCSKCHMTFAWKSTLNKHIASNHRPDGPQKFVCDICPKVYNTLSQVNEHVKRDHLKQRNHICPHCGKTFFKKFDMKIHSRTHTNERPYICRICGKQFHHQSHIIRHERTHSGEKPYTCDICKKTFTQPDSLKVHKQKHQQIKDDIFNYQMDENDPFDLIKL